MKILGNSSILNYIYLTPNKKLTSYSKKDEVNSNVETTSFPFITNQYPIQTNINFKSQPLPMALINDLKKISDVPCPCCGTKMLSSEGFDRILKQTENIHTAREIVQMFDILKKYINPSFNKLISEISLKASENLNMDSENFLEKIHENYVKESDKQVKILEEKLLNLYKQKERSQEEKDSVKKTLKKIKYMSENVHRRSFYKHTKQALKDCFLPFSDQDKYKLYKELNNTVKNAFVKEYLIFRHENDNKKRSQLLFFNLLSYSKADVHKVYDKAPLVAENITLCCNSCNYSGKTIYNKGNDPQNYFNYIYAMSREALNGNIPSQKNYPILLQNYVRKWSKNKLSANNTQIDYFKLCNEPEIKQLLIQDFPIVHHSGIHCASCGQKTLTHEEKGLIIHKIAQANTPSDLLNILNENRDVIKQKFDNILNDFNYQLNKNPEITERHLIKKLKATAYRDLRRKILENAEYVKNIIENENLTKKEKLALDLFSKYLEKTVETNTSYKLYSADFYKKIFDELLEQLEDKPALQKDLCNNVFAPTKTVYSVQRSLFPQQEIVMKVGSTLKTITENIIARSLATIDHLNPKIRYQSDEDAEQYTRFLSNKKHNLVVMCKECNSSKGSQELSEWVKLHPELKENLKKYLEQVKNLQKSGELGQEYLLYPYGVKFHFEKITGIEL